MDQELALCAKSERMLRLERDQLGEKERQATGALKNVTKQLDDTKDALHRCQHGASLMSKELSDVKRSEESKANQMSTAKQSLDAALQQRDSIIERLSAQLEESVAECNQLRDCNVDLQSAIETDVRQLHDALCQAQTEIEQLQQNVSDESRRSAVSASQTDKMRTAQDELKRSLREAESLLLRTDEERFGSMLGLVLLGCCHKGTHLLHIELLTVR